METWLNTVRYDCARMSLSKRSTGFDEHREVDRWTQPKRHGEHQFTAHLSPPPTIWAKKPISGTYTPS